MNGGSVDLAEFLLARIGEDETAARAATPGPWDFADEHGLLPEADAAWCINQMRPGYEAMSETEGYIGDVAEVLWRHKDTCPDAEQIARWDPVRVLAECEAKRVLISLCQTPDPHSAEEAGDGCTECAVLYTMAAVYSSHPDYRSDWAP